MSLEPYTRYKSDPWYKDGFIWGIIFFVIILVGTVVLGISSDRQKYEMCRQKNAVPVNSLNSQEPICVKLEAIAP